MLTSEIILQVETDDQETVSVLSERREVGVHFYVLILSRPTHNDVTKLGGYLSQEDDLHPLPTASTSASGLGRERTVRVV